MALTPIGLAVFFWLLLTGTYPLFSNAGSHGLGLVVLMLAGGLAIPVGAPLVLGLANRGIVMAGAVIERAHRIALSFRE